MEKAKSVCKNSNIDGILIVDKPAGMTSRDVVNKIGRILNTKSVGHTGTLDPLATGVLVVTMGKANKLCKILTSEYKEYVATFTLGYEADTLDIEGRRVANSDKKVSDFEIREVIDSFKGSYLQEVPLYSAVKVNGRRLYDYARNGIDVELPKREVTIKEIDIVSIGKDIVIRTSVSKGTYIRSLIRDIGRKLGTYATMTDLRRTKQGKFTIEDAVRLDSENLKESIKDFTECIDDLAQVEVEDLELLKKVSNGVVLDSNYGTLFVLFKKNDERIALYRLENGQYRMFIKF